MCLTNAWSGGGQEMHYNVSCLVILTVCHINQLLQGNLIVMHYQCQKFKQISGSILYTAVRKKIVHITLRL